MPWNKKRSYNLLKSDTKSKTANGTYTKRQKREKFQTLRAVHQQTHQLV